MFLSSSETTLTAHVELDGRRKANAGQETRLANIPADAGKGLGVFENLHGAATPAEFANQINEAVLATTVVSSGFGS